MKKSFLFLCAAIAMMAACNKSEVVSVQEPNELVLKSSAAQTVKGAELDGAILPKTYGIYAAATQKNASGLIENPIFFVNTEQLFATTEDEPASGPDTRYWHASPSKVYWPIGGVRMDYLAYAELQANHQPITATEAAKPAIDAGGNWVAFWNDYLTSSANKLSFNGVDTYKYQNDVLFAAKNDQTSLANGYQATNSEHSVKMDFQHAQALLIFNVKNNFANADEATAANMVIDEIAFLTPERVQAVMDHQVYVASLLDPSSATPLADLKNTDVTLKTVGTFTVDNSANNLVAGWSFAAPSDEASNTKGCTRVGNYKMPNYDNEGTPAVSTANNGTNKTALASACQKYGAKLDFVTGNAYAQLGETLLIPEQDKVNFTIKYHYAGTPDKFYYYTFNDLRGVWQMGHKYIYSLDLTINEIVITESVFDFIDAFDGDPSRGGVANMN